MVYFHSFRNPGLIIDIVQDIRKLNDLSRLSRKAGMIILGGGVCKHQIANAMLIVRLTFIFSRSGRFLMLQLLAQRCRLLGVHRTLLSCPSCEDVSDTPFIRTQAKNLTAQTLVHVQTKPFHGAKSVPGQNQ